MICGFCPARWNEEPDNLPPGPRAEPRETVVLDQWVQAEAEIGSRPRSPPPGLPLSLPSPWAGQGGCAAAVPPMSA